MCIQCFVCDNVVHCQHVASIIVLYKKKKVPCTQLISYKTVQEKTNDCILYHTDFLGWLLVWYKTCHKSFVIVKQLIMAKVNKYLLLKKKRKKKGKFGT